MQAILPDQIQQIYDIVGQCLSQMRRRPRSNGHEAEDRDEIHHAVFATLVTRAQKRWDGVRPITAYVAAAASKEVQKFQNRARSRELRSENK